jgi:hypothetical protein
MTALFLGMSHIGTTASPTIRSCLKPSRRASAFPFDKSTRKQAIAFGRKAPALGLETRPALTRADKGSNKNGSSLRA